MRIKRDINTRERHKRLERDKGEKDMRKYIREYRDI